MPIKFSPSVKTVNRQTKQVETQYYYIKQMSKESLLDYINKEGSVVPKRRAKCINELQRRGIKIEWVKK
jgi:uncharacterized protein YutE (UPF0331/DUF86 family)